MTCCSRNCNAMFTLTGSPSESEPIRFARKGLSRDFGDLIGFPLAFLILRRNIDTLYMDAKAAQQPGMIRFLAWFEVNKKRVLIGTIIVLVVGLVIGLAIYYQSQREVRASAALSEVHTPMNPTAAPAPGTAEAYKKVAEEHKGTQAAGRALILAGTTLYTQGQYEEAQKLFERFARDYPGSPFVPEALYGIASSLDAEKKPADAIA